MFIELTDHLRCPADHDEAFLVLIPETVAGRDVTSGILGCPICNREYPVTAGVAHFGAPVTSGAPASAVAGIAPDAAAVLSFLSLDGPGGYVTLVGQATGLAGGLRALLPGVHLVAVNPNAELAGISGLSVLRSPQFPVKSRSQRGVVLGLPEADDPEWRRRAVAAVLPGLRIAGEGPLPESRGFELLASAAGWWVGRTG